MGYPSHAWTGTPPTTGNSILFETPPSRTGHRDVTMAMIYTHVLSKGGLGVRASSAVFGLLARELRSTICARAPSGGTAGLFRRGLSG